jgi:hypothetical protein
LRNKIHLSRGTGRARCFTWNYNSNGIQELQEFEVVHLSTKQNTLEYFRVFVKTHQTKFSIGDFKPRAVANESGLKVIFLFLQSNLLFN